MDELRTTAVVLSGVVAFIGFAWTWRMLDAVEPERRVSWLEYAVPVALFWAGLGLVVAAVVV